MNRRGWSPEEVGQMYGKPPHVIRRLLRRRELSGRKVGRGWLITQRDLDAFEGKGSAA